MGSERHDVPGRSAYLARWSALHGGFDPASSVWVNGWLSMAYALARPLARRAVSPHLVTLLGVAVSCAVPASSAAGGRWPLLGAVAAVAVGVLDGMDGAVAVLGGRVTPTGAVLDSVADRVTDAAFFTAFWLLGAPGPLCAGLGALTLVGEYARARAGAQGVAEIGVVTVWERPTRVILTAVLTAGAAVLPGRAQGWATWGTSLGVLVATVGAGQLWRFLRRTLAERP